MVNYADFILKEKAIFIAPAGYGKTHLIVESLNAAIGKQLVLTHTHAGVAAIKERIKKSKIASNKYKVETITSFAQKYVFAFYTGNDIPKQEDSKQYYPFIIDKCYDLFKINLISEIFKRTYSGLFVDEYQDCNKDQHKMIKEIAQHLPTRILGDPLQGIFDFNGSEIVDLEDEIEFKDFNVNKFKLTTPWRWKKSNEALGNELDQIRSKLILGESIDILHLKSIETKKYKPYDYNFNNFIFKLLKEESLLIIHPKSANLHARIGFNKRFGNKFYLLESIDGKDFYQEASKLDSITTENSFEVLIRLSEKLFNKKVLNNWFNKTGVKNKKKTEDKVYSNKLKEILNDLNKEIKMERLLDYFEAISNLPKTTAKRKDLLNSLMKAINDSSLNGKNIYDSMLSHRNKIRVIGRKVTGKCIGTTLLTKGLEFDTVVILKANEFTCKKNFYVAISRACSRLVLCYEKDTIDFS